MKKLKLKMKMKMKMKMLLIHELKVTDGSAHFAHFAYHFVFVEV
jgi:hypothetical protein